ncbi:MAG TPA: hypothetical protein VIL46_02305, partial [Gemmataceae bacterium]
MYHTWTRPEVVRQLLLRQLQEQLDGVEIRLDSARLRLLGGISFSGLELRRAGDPDGEPFLTIPSGRVYHDKQALGNGRLVVRKLELEEPHLRLRRREDGTWNTSGLFRPGAAGGPLPVVVVRRATVTVEDAARPGEGDVVRDGFLTLVNDPDPQVSFECHAVSDLLGPLTVSGRANRSSGEARAELTLSGFRIGAALLERLKAYAPRLAALRGRAEGDASLRLGLAYRPGAEPPVQYQAHLHVTGGRLEAPGQLPLPLEEVELKAFCQNGHLTVEEARARAGGCRVQLGMELFLPPPGAGEAPEEVSAGAAPAGAPEVGIEQDFPEGLEQCLHRLDLTVEHLDLKPSLFSRLPARLRTIQRMFEPSGPVHVTYQFRRDGPGERKRCVVRLGGLRALYEDFPYPMEQVRGTLELTLGAGRPDRLAIDVTALASGRPVALRGTIVGETPEAEVRLRITGEGIPFNEALIRALPDPFPAFVRKLNARGRGDFIADVRQEAGTHELHKRFEVRVRDTALCYDLFPYALEGVRGTLVIVPPPSDTRRMGAAVRPPAAGGDPLQEGVLELRDFTARHGDTLVRLGGRKAPSPQGSTLTLHIHGRGLALDADLRAAVAAVGLGTVWDEFAPRGRTDASVTVTVHDRFQKVRPAAALAAPGGGAPPELPFDPAEDLELTLALSGGSVEPVFFPYRLWGVSGRLDYARGKVGLTNCRAAHGDSEWVLARGDVRPRADGGFWADLRDLSVRPLRFDAELLGALPPGLRALCAGLEPRGPMRLELRRLVVDDPDAGAPPVRTVSTAPPPPAPADPPPVIYWDGALHLAGASLTAGVGWDGVTGQVACRGLYAGDRLGSVIGNALLDRARVAGQPVADGRLRFLVDPREPEALRVPAIQGRLFGGEVGGEALVTLAEPVLYDLKLNATQVSLAELAGHYRLGPSARLEGLATAQLFLTNRPEEPGGAPLLRGGGNIDVPSGKILNLPLLLDLLKVLNLRAPDRTAFEEAHAVFEVRGDRVTVRQLDLLGNAIS